MSEEKITFKLTDSTKRFLQNLRSVQTFPRQIQSEAFTDEEMLQAEIKANALIERLIGNDRGGYDFSKPEGFDKKQDGEDAIVAIIKGLQREDLTVNPIAKIINTKYNRYSNYPQSHVENFAHKNERKLVADELKQVAASNGLENVAARLKTRPKAGRGGSED